jgi:hypothetical protein
MNPNLKTLDTFLEPLDMGRVARNKNSKKKKKKSVMSTHHPFMVVHSWVLVHSHRLSESR